MKRLERILAALTPKRWPVRWRLAAVSATLTLIILVIFAVVVGRLTSNRLQSDFNDDLRGTATHDRRRRSWSSTHSRADSRRIRIASSRHGAPRSGTAHSRS